MVLTVRKIQPIWQRMLRMVRLPIKNKSQKQYELPETGGSGVKMHYVLGVALVLLTTGSIILKVLQNISSRR